MESKISFAIEKLVSDQTGQVIDGVVKLITHEDGTVDRETWCTILDLDKLFDTCVTRWGKNWNLEKVCAAIAETEIE